MFKLAIAICVACLPSSLDAFQAADDAFRVWNSKDGKFTVKAKLLDIEGENAKLLTEDGRTILVEFSRLSVADVKYCNSHAQNPTQSPEEISNDQPYDANEPNTRGIWGLIAQKADAFSHEFQEIFESDKTTVQKYDALRSAYSEFSKSIIGRKATGHFLISDADAIEARGRNATAWIVLGPSDLPYCFLTSQGNGAIQVPLEKQAAMNIKKGSVLQAKGRIGGIGRNSSNIVHCYYPMPGISRDVARSLGGLGSEMGLRVNELSYTSLNFDFQCPVSIRIPFVISEVRIITDESAEKIADEFGTYDPTGKTSVTFGP